MVEAALDKTATSTLDSLREYSTIVADSGEFETIRAFGPTDATTNPSLVWQAARQPAYAALVEQARAVAPAPGLTVVERLMLLFGRELTAVVPRYVSTEVDARLSFDTAATVVKARALIAGYETLGVPSDRILIKIAATWEGVAAARVLEAEGIRCNMTLIFSLIQAQACFDAGATLISPFVGRITDWYKQAQNVTHFAAEDDPGVLGVRRINSYAKAYGYPTLVMAASFRHVDQILALAGTDLMTISPKLLSELAGMSDRVEISGSPAGAAESRVHHDRAGFAWALNADAMATDRLADGIRRFAADQAQLETYLAGLS